MVKKVRTFTIEDELWQQFLKAVPKGDASREIRNMIAEYLHDKS